MPWADYGRHPTLEAQRSRGSAVPECEGPIEGSDRARIGLHGARLTLGRGLRGLLGRYSSSAVFGDEHLIMPISVGMPRSDYGGERAMNVKQVL